MGVGIVAKRSCLVNRSYCVVIGDHVRAHCRFPFLQSLLTASNQRGTIFSWGSQTGIFAD